MPPPLNEHQDVEIIPGLRREWMILSRRRWLILGLPIIALIAAAAYNRGARPVYEATAIVSISEHLPGVPVGRRMDPQRKSELMEEETNRITGVDFAARVIEQIGDPERAELTSEFAGAWWRRLLLPTVQTPGPVAALSPARAVGGLLSRLSVSWRDPSSWVEIRVSGYEPRAVAALANAAAQAYVRETAAANLRAIEASRASLDDQIESRQEALGKQLSDLVDLGQQSGLARKAVLQRQILAFQEALVAARTERIGRAATRQEWARLEGGALVTSTNPRILATQDRLSDLEDQEKALLANLGALHPEVISIREQIESTRSRLAAAAATEAKAARTAFDLALAEESRIEGSLRRAEAELEALQKESVDYTMGQQQATVNQLAVERLMQRQEIGDAMSAVGTLESSLIEPATVASAPSTPKKGRNLAYALVGGLLGGILLAWFLQRLDDSVQTPDDIRALLGLPFLGMIPLVPRLNAASLGTSLLDDNTGLGDGVRVVRTNLMFGADSSKLRVLLFTSASPGDGKSTVASAVALLLRETHARVLLLDADLRRPSLHTLFALPGTPGLSDWLETPDPGDPPVSHTQHIDVLCAGSPKVVSAARLGSPAMKRLIEWSRDHYDWIIIDSPPSLGLPDSSVLSTLVDGVVVVCAGDRTPRKAVLAAVEQLGAVGAHMVGVVLNRVDLNRHSYYYGRYYSPSYGAANGRAPVPQEGTPVRVEPISEAHTAQRTGQDR